MACIHQAAQMTVSTFFALPNAEWFIQELRLSVRAQLGQTTVRAASCQPWRHLLP